MKDEETEKLFAPLQIDDMASASDIAKEFNTRLAGIQKWVEKQVTSATKRVTDDFENKSKETEYEKIREFAKTHPELKPGSEVAAMMEQLYTKNKNLEEIYKKACIANDLKPIAINKGKIVNLSTGNEIDKDGTEVDKKQNVSSLRSDMFKADTDDLDDGDLVPNKDVVGKSIREIADANWNKALADAGLADLPND